MNRKTNRLVSKAACLVEENEQIASDEDVISISNRFLAKNKQAYEVLATEKSGRKVKL